MSDLTLIADGDVDLAKARAENVVLSLSEYSPAFAALEPATRQLLVLSITTAILHGEHRGLQRAKEELFDAPEKFIAAKAWAKQNLLRELDRG